MYARRHLPSIPSLLALEAVARLGSASAAAAELNLTQGAVSRQLQVLEDQLGTTLLLRGQQRLRLTPAAQEFVEQARRALDQIGAAAHLVRANPGGGALNLAILPAFGMHWLAPRLPSFASAHPEVTVNLLTRLKPFDFGGGAFDAAIHYGKQDWPGAAYLKLLDEDLLAVVSPDLIQSPLKGADQVLSLPLLSIDSRPGDWPRWFTHHGQSARPAPAMRFDHFATMIESAVHGLGAALVPTFLLDRTLSEGRLVPLFGGPVRASGSYYLTWPAAAAARSPLNAFRAWLEREIA